MAGQPINIDRVIEAHQAIKAARQARKQQWEVEDAALETDQNKLRAVLLNYMNTTGAKNIATAHGTAYRMQKIKPSAADWGAIWDWMKEDGDRFEIMERRLKSGFVKQYMEEHEGQLPPGVNVHTEFEVAVRRPKAPLTS